MTDDTVHPQGSDVIAALTAAVREVNTANGWHDDARTFGDGIALLHSEVSEAFEAYRDHGLADFTGAPKHRPGCSRSDHIVYGMPGDVPPCTCGVLAKPEGVGSEFADVLIRLLDECDRRGIPLWAETLRKLAYNRTRGHKHGGKLL